MVFLDRGAREGFSRMKNTLSTAPETLALRRLSLVERIIELNQQHWPLSAALEQVSSSHPLIGDADDPPRFVPKRTLEDWYYAFKKGGFEALRPQARCDRGKPRRLSPVQQQWILERVRSFPGVAVKLLYRQWKQTDLTLPALSAVYRWLEANDLDAHGRRYLLRQNIPGPTKAFEAPGVNDLWMADFSPGPFLASQPKPMGTQLCVLIDDHSRLIPFAAYGTNADTQAFLRCLKEALRRRGLPRRLYADNGGPFVNDHLKIVCANLGIRLVHSKPGQPWSRGKVERFFRTLQEDFEATLRLPGQSAGSLDELNGKLSRWLQEVYHCRVHQGTGESPQERFGKALSLVRTVDPHLDLDRLFYTRIERVVRKDGTVRIDNQLHEVNLALRGLCVQLEFDPWVLDPVLVGYKGQDFGQARKVDRHLNSQLQGSSHYERA
jgi:transposase InsO family protein